jgi:hypothetical protein
MLRRMPPQSDPDAVPILTGGEPVVDLSRPLPQAGGGLPAFAAVDWRGGSQDLVAIAIARSAPARALVIQRLTEPIENLMAPRGWIVGPAPDGGQAGYVVCTAPRGMPLAVGLKPWPESALVSRVLRPIAQILDQLQEQGFTHRAIRLNNVFDPGRGQPVTLGAGWAAPPAMHQPALYEPAYSAVCHPAARGNGTIADDVYALGVLLIVLALGHEPMAGLDDVAILGRKLEHGSYGALTGDSRLPPLIADLARGMLAQDPEHRPSPALLLDPISARGRRVAARPPRRAGRPLQVGRTMVSDAHALAYGIGREPDAGMASLRSGETMHWLRRGLGDAGLAVRLEELLRRPDPAAAQGDSQSDAETVMRAVALVDPLAPLFWRGIGLWPDGVGSLLAWAQQDDPALAGRLGDMIGREAVAGWAALRADRCNAIALRQEARQQRVWIRTRGPSGGVPRLAYALNPLLPCGSAVLERRWVTRLHELVPALEEAAAEMDHEADPIDAPIAAFLAARGDRRLESEINGLDGDRSVEGGTLSRLRLLSHLQIRYHPRPLPRLAAWFAAHAEPLVQSWHNRPRRKQIAVRLQELAAEGMLGPLLALLDDPAARFADVQGAQVARADHARIEHELVSVTQDGQARRRRAMELGQECAAGLGLVTLALMLILAALG